MVIKPYTFSAGATIIAAEHNANFDVLYNEVNSTVAGSLTTDNPIALAPIFISGGSASILTSFTISVTTANVIGTANQILISGGSGAVMSATTFSLPQSIDTAASVSFNTATLGALISTVITSGNINAGITSASTFATSGTGKFGTVFASTDIVITSGQKLILDGV